MNDPQIILPPYAETIGVTVESRDGGRTVLGIDYAEAVSGNPGTFHGGVIAGLMEAAGLAAMGARGGEGFRAINTTVEYLRGAGAQRLHAAGTVVRAGRRLSNVRVEAWQDDPARPVATAVLNVVPVQARV